MIVLGLDTTGKACSAALVSRDGLLAYRRKVIGRGHAEQLGPQVQDVLAQANIKPYQIDRIAVCAGPGSFTGLRVALAFAKGLALPHNIAVLGVSGLFVRAMTANPSGRGQIMAAQDVRRKEIFWQIFDQRQATAAPKLSPLVEVQSALTEAMDVTGSASEMLGRSAGEDFIDPAILAWLAMDANPTDHPPAPLYHRPPDAKLPGGITPR